MNNIGLPRFFFKNFTNGTATGFASSNDIGDYQMKCVAVDFANETTIVQWTLFVKRKIKIKSFLYFIELNFR